MWEKVRGSGAFWWGVDIKEKTLGILPTPVLLPGTDASGVTIKWDLETAKLLGRWWSVGVLHAMWEGLPGPPGLPWLCLGRSDLRGGGS